MPKKGTERSPLGQAIFEAVMEEGKRLKDVAEALGIGPNAVSQRLSAKTGLNLENAQDLAWAQRVANIVGASFDKIMRRATELQTGIAQPPAPFEPTVADLALSVLANPSADQTSRQKAVDILANMLGLTHWIVGDQK